VAAARQTLTRAEAGETRRGRVLSPYGGLVGALQAQRGQYVAAGAPLITIEPVLEPLTVVLYIPLDQAKKVKVGQDVQVVPANVSEEEWGHLLATVALIDDMASTPEGMQAVLQNEFLVASLAAQGPVVRAEASLLADISNPSGYAWSTSSGPPERISTGTTCTGRIVLETSPPITYAFPALKHLLGGDS
jgi:HlyD family secretion protein